MSDSLDTDGSQSRDEVPPSSNNRSSLGQPARRGRQSGCQDESPRIPEAFETAEKALTQYLKYIDKTDPDRAAAIRTTLNEKRLTDSIVVTGRPRAGKTSLICAITANNTDTASPSNAHLHNRTQARLDNHGPLLTFHDLPPLRTLLGPYRHASANTLTEAGTIIYVIDARRIITPRELDELGTLLATSPSVAVVINQMDVNLRGAKAVADESTKLIKGYYGESINIFYTETPPLKPYSPATSQSDVIDLRNHLSLTVDDGNFGSASTPFTNTHSSNLKSNSALLRALQQAHLTIQEDKSTNRLRLNKSLVDSPSGAISESELGNKLKDIDEEIKKIKNMPASGRIRLSGKIASARSLASADLDKHISDIRQTWTRYFENNRKDAILSHADDIVDALNDDLSHAARDVIMRYMQSLRKSYMRLTLGEGDWGKVIEDVQTSRGDNVEYAEHGANPGSKSQPPDEIGVKELIDPSLLTVSLSGGVGLTYAASLLPGVGGVIAATGGIPIVAAAGVWLTFNLFFRAARQGKRSLTTWLRDSLNEARRSISYNLEQLSFEIGPTVQDHFQSDITYITNKRVQHLRSIASELQDSSTKASKLHRLAQNEQAFLEKVDSSFVKALNIVQPERQARNKD